MPVRILSRPATPAHGIASPRAAIPRETPLRHAARLRTLAGPRSRTARSGVAVVLVLTFVGLFYLSQIFEAAAARYEVQQLAQDRQVMLQELQTQQGTTRVRGSESTVIQWAQDHGLEPLRAPVKISAH